MLDLLRRPIWALGAVIVLVVATVFVSLGMWQLRRLDERRAFNEAVAEARQSPPVRGAIGPGDEHRTVVLSGTWTGDEVDLVLRTLQGRPGSHRLSVLETEAGPVLVDRGFYALDTTLPPASGSATVEGRVVGGAPSTRVTEGEERPGVSRVDLDTIGNLVGEDLGDVYVVAEAPLGRPAPTPIPPPELSDGPHLSYAIQWFAFALITVIGFAALIHRTARGEPGPRPPAPERAP